MGRVGNPNSLLSQPFVLPLQVALLHAEVGQLHHSLPRCATATQPLAALSPTRPLQVALLHAEVGQLQRENEALSGQLEAVLSQVDAVQQSNTRMKQTLLEVGGAGASRTEYGALAGAGSGERARAGRRGIGGGAGAWRPQGVAFA